MKRFYTPLIFAAAIGLTNAAFSQATLRADGANIKIVASGSPSIVLNNAHFANNASSTMFTGATSEVRFVGNATTQITSTGPFNTTFANVEINKTGGTEIDVMSNGMSLITALQMEMVSGNIDMNLNLGSTWELGTGIGAVGTLVRTSGHLYNGHFLRWYNAGAGVNTIPWEVPVGMNAASYNYAKFYYTGASSGGTLRIRFIPLNPFYTGMPMVDATNFATCGAPVNINNCANEGYWEVIRGGGIDNTGTYTAELCYNNFSTVGSAACLRIIKSENLTSWMQEGTHGTNGSSAGNLFVTRDAQTGFPSGANSSLFTIAGDVAINPLPVELSAFNANCGTGSIMVNWTTASENNNSYFVLERTKDLITWEIVSTVSSLNGNSNTVQNYAYEDHVFGGTFYYRLNQVDINGDVTTYPPITLTCNGGSADPSIVNTYQNSDGQISVVLFAPSEVDYVLGLYNISGQKIQATKGMLGGGNTTIMLDAHLLRDAYYLVNVQIGDKNLSRKIFVK
jgi:hypothetical protein